MTISYGDGLEKLPVVELARRVVETEHKNDVLIGVIQSLIEVIRELEAELKIAKEGQAMTHEFTDQARSFAERDDEPSEVRRLRDVNVALNSAYDALMFTTKAIEADLTNQRMRANQFRDAVRALADSNPSHVPTSALRAVLAHTSQQLAADLRNGPRSQDET